MSTDILTPLLTALRPAGSDFRILIQDITPDVTLDRIRLTLDLYCPSMPKYSGQKTIIIKHDDFEDWCDSQGLLTQDSTWGTCDHEGEYQEYGGEVEIPYTDFIQWHVTRADYIMYLWQMEDLPRFAFCPDFLKENNVTL